MHGFETATGTHDKHLLEKDLVALIQEAFCIFRVKLDTNLDFPGRLCSAVSRFS